MSNYNSAMNLAADASHNRAGARHDGYAMAAFLIGMSVMATLMTVVLPTWNQMLQREKEEELATCRSAVPARTYARVSEAAIDRLVRERLGLPTISV